LWWACVAIAVLAAVGLAVERWSGLSLPAWSRTVGVVLIAVIFAAGLAVRTGANALWAGGAAGVAAAAAMSSGIPWIVSGLAVALTLLTSVFAVLITRPGQGWLPVVREVLIAAAVAVVGALGVAATHATVDPVRFDYITLGLALVWVLLIVNGLGAGLHGLGRRGVLMILVGTLVLALALAYGEALRRWGSPGLVLQLETIRTRAVDLLGAVPHPLAAILGVPALAWGVWMRTRRRQGWWACAFGVTMTVTVASLLLADLTPVRAGLGVLYTLLIGLVIGFAVIALDAYFTGPRGSRATRGEASCQGRPEPSRTASLR